MFDFLLIKTFWKWVYSKRQEFVLYHSVEELIYSFSMLLGNPIEDRVFECAKVKITKHSIPMAQKEEEIGN